ncbi:flagellar biosynthesis protein [Pseudomonas brassicae]|uniref:flagellar biosynthesis protein n=1 Tax=Pseudomonas brassicae TaxID=2708063 RepID=UPI0015B71F01|nr:flagellar biosynthesis protein [Pseudomonas brassicae]
MNVRIALAVVVLAFTTGCATSRSEIDVNVAQLGAGQIVAPGNGKKVHISAVDERVFQIKPRSADIPSLKNDEVTDRSITERAIARKRNGYGKGLGDVLLPSGRTVSRLVSDAVASAYRQAGYEVVTDANTQDAATVKVHIVEFWSWFSPGFFSVAVNNKSHLTIEAPGTAQLQVVTRKSDNMQAVTENDWKEITEAGLEEITQQTFKQL